MGKESACSAGVVGAEGLIPGLGRSPGEQHDNPPVFLPGESHGQRSLQSIGSKELDTTEVAEHTHMHHNKMTH